MEAWLPAPRARTGLAVVLVALALLRVGEAAGGLPGWAAAWGDDAVCLPLVLTLALLAHRLIGREPAWRLPKAHGLAAVAIFAVVFELLLPAVDARATADPWDAVVYLGGWFFFQTIINAKTPAVPAARTV
ncbi:MAG: hypothetical protein GY838_19085 [bacterium]|nr:hypothetical protein [bacterium]